MKCGLDDQNRMEIVSDLVSLRGGVPVINGAALEGWQAQVTWQGEALTVHFRSTGLGEVTFGVELHNGNAEGDPGWLCYWVEEIPQDLVLHSFGLRFTSIENLRAYLRQGYQSWDGSYYVEPEVQDGEEDPGRVVHTGYAMTQLLPRWGRSCAGGAGSGSAGSLVLGFDRHDCFQQTFTFSGLSPSLTVETLWDRKDRRGGERCESERLLFFTSEGVEEGLRSWAMQVAAASPAPPRLPDPPVTGWSSWYNLYAAITEENLLEHLRSAVETARREDLPLRIFQIDDGFTPEMGDWLEVKPQFPRGMKSLLDEIRRAGFIPGLWIAPFMVGNRSRLYRDHPDWVVRDRETGGPLVQSTYYGEFRWHKRSEEYYILDTTHPQAIAYLREVFRTWRREWGCEYFKTDFMFFGSDNGPQRAAWHTPGLTRIEIWRRAAELIREEIGSSATWLGCGCPLWAGVGLVDAVRIGRDVGVEWRGERSAMSLLRDGATRSFANGILWQGDPDAVLLRERFHHLSDTEVRSLALYAGMTGGVMMTSDDLGALSPGRLLLWRLLLSGAGRPCSFPLLGESQAAYQRPHEAGVEPAPSSAAPGDPVLVQVRPRGGAEGMAAVLFFNLSDHPVQRTYPLPALGLPTPRYALEWEGSEAGSQPVEALSMLLPPHAARLFFLLPEPFPGVPETLP